MGKRRPACWLLLGLFLGFIVLPAMQQPLDPNEEFSCPPVNVTHEEMCSYYLTSECDRDYSMLNVTLEGEFTSLACDEEIHATYMQNSFNVQYRDAHMGDEYLLLMYDADYPEPCNDEKIQKGENYLYLAFVFTSPEEGLLMSIIEYAAYEDHGSYREALHRVQLGLWVFSHFLGQELDMAKYRRMFKKHQLLDALGIKSNPSAVFEFKVGTAVRLRYSNPKSRLLVGSAMLSTMSTSAWILTLSVFATLMSL